MAPPTTAPPNDGAVTTNTTATPAYKPRYIDIGINLADPIFRGVYNGKQRHDDDLSGVVDRARQVGCTKLIVTGSSFKSSRDALAIAEQYPGTVYTTAGIHPCSSAIFDAAHPYTPNGGGADDADDADDAEEEAEHTPPCGPDPDAPLPEETARTDPARTEAILAALAALIDAGRASGRLVALGEFGLDYDRLHYCPRALQRHSFAAQLRLAAETPPQQQLPLFLHSRAAHADFVACLRDAFGPRLERLARGGVVHSFTGTAAEMTELMDLGLYVGLNGCSFKTEDNCRVVEAVRLDRLMLETDGPWCEVRPTHEGWRYLVEMERREREREAAAAASQPPQETGTPAEPTPSTTEGAKAGPENGSADTPQARPRQKKKPQQQPQQSSKKPQKKESEVPERFKVVKKEKWVEGAMVKGRNEPCTIERVARIVAAIKGVGVEEVCEAAWRNSVRVFGLDEEA